MGRSGKEDLERILDDIIIKLDDGGIPENISIIDKIDFSNLSKEDVEILIKKVNYVIEKISEKQKSIVKSVAEKTELKNYRF